ncbi:hypothetical protein [Streptomyces sp. DSM 40750]|uniref:hypothetical protein n=1 Tax=Streptomyces sp. DSM 40750 TaxID=2801030 RepID=UPI00214C1A25|nr:hypothetical protein [Streptomyces sp. DSM 40750]UUU24714.1 hypothetical protein JIX55_33170 [Streptomyces sp. DSM 40750]
MLTNIVIGCLAAAMAATAVLGAIAIRTRWMVPWLRRSTLRPVLWGYASLAGSAGMGLWSFGMMADRADVYGLAGLILLITNAVLSFLATRPGRVTTP